MKKLFLGIFLSLLALSLSAREGMWLPQMIAKLNYGEMQRMGLQLEADEIYSFNNASLKDAIVHFNGGCTAELISSEGLLLTNHHCGYSMIQKHSTLEDNYLEKGFWAMSRSEEKANPGVTASIVKYLEDVSQQVMADVSDAMSVAERDSTIAASAKQLLEQRAQGENYDFEIKSFFYGNQYILIAKEVFRDVRLVGAPPSSIGKFGADTDNWMWPRHTGDFSLFRIYAGKDNLPAPFSAENSPYRPRQHLKINIAGVQDGDFTMVYGFPGSTQQYLPAAEVKNIAEHYNPARIAVRDAILEILDAKMRRDEATRLKYASKYARISNSWKRWKGEIIGLEATDAVAKKRAKEIEFERKLDSLPQFDKYKDIIPRLIVLYQQRVPLYLQRYSYIETGYFGVEAMRHMLRYRTLVKLYEEGDREALAEEALKLSNSMGGFYKDYEAALDEEVMQAVLPMFLAEIEKEPLPEILVDLKGMDRDKRQKYIRRLFAKNPVNAGEEEWSQLLANKPRKAAKKLAKSAAYQLSTSMYDYYFGVLTPELGAIDREIEKLQARYVAALADVFPERALFPDANSTLRLSYGKVMPYQARDAVIYQSQTYLEGVMEKYQPGDYEFDLPQKLVELYRKKNYGSYGKDGKMPVCFVATNHTTGGNSGSPALNARGELIGLNFDRAWEGVMSDMYFDTTRCRNIMVDARYVLFIIDKFGGAGYLVEEMDLVSQAVRPTEAKEEPVEEFEQEIME